MTKAQNTSMPEVRIGTSEDGRKHLSIKDGGYYESNTRALSERSTMAIYRGIVMHDELLKALVDMVMVFAASGKRSAPFVLEQARATIAKARGENAELAA